MDNAFLLVIYIFIFVYGIVIGSFLNVVILRVPLKETIVSKRSHCMKCGNQLKWYDLVPLFSYLILRGKCRSCKAPISKQYPIIEAANGIGYVTIVAVNGPEIDSIFYCLMFSALLALSVIDFRTYEIPVGINIFLLVLGIIHTAINYKDWSLYVIGMVSVSFLLAILYYASGGRAIGGGDVKLMGAVGLLLGWKLIILAFFLGCIIGSVIHLARMKISGEQHVLAMGPYLSVGIIIAALWGNRMIDWYIGTMF